MIQHSARSKNGGLGLLVLLRQRNTTEHSIRPLRKAPASSNTAVRGWFAASPIAARPSPQGPRHRHPGADLSFHDRVDQGGQWPCPSYACGHAVGSIGERRLQARLVSGP